MLTPRHIRCGVLATMVAAMGLLSVAAAAPPPPAPPDPAELPDAGGVVAGFQQVRQWISRFDLPQLEDPASRIPIEHATAACILVRHDGRLVGSGMDATADALMLRRATGRALGRVLGHPALSRLTERLRKEDASGKDVENLRRSLGRTLTLEVEVGGRFVPLLGRTYKQVAKQIEPGLDGVAMRRGQTWALLFPSRLRANNRSANILAALPTLATDLGLASAPLNELIRQHDVTIYRFRTTHLAQAAPDARPFSTFRGDQLVPLDAVTVDSVARLADGIAGRLVNTLWPAAPPPWVDGTYDKPPGVMGDYHPIADEYSPVSAPPIAQALTSFALSVYAGTPGVAPEAAQRADAAALLILHDLHDWGSREPAVHGDMDSAAAIVYAITARPDAQRQTDPLLRSLLQHATTTLINESSNDASRLRKGHAQALVAGALARLLVSADGDGDADPVPSPDLVRRMIDFAWRNTAGSRQVTLMPWIGWAEADVATANGTPLANSGAIRRVRELVNLTQIGTPQQPGPEDIHGGFALRRGDESRVDAQGTRPMITLGWMLHQPALTSPEDRAAAIDRQRRAARFLMQLVARESTLWAYPNADRVRGGIRASSWDADQPVLAQAMGLLAACETLRGLSVGQVREPTGVGGVQNTVEIDDG